MELAGLAHALAQLGVRAPVEVWKAIAASAEEKAVAGALRAREASTLLWALATAEQEAPGLSRACSGRVAAAAGGAEPVEVINAMWALAKTGEAGEGGSCGAEFLRLEEAAAEHLRAAGPGMRGQSVAVLAWAFAKAGRGSAEVFRELEEAALGGQLSSMAPQVRAGATQRKAAGVDRQREGRAAGHAEGDKKTERGRKEGRKSNR